jgi:hypothetical protein
MKTLIRSLALCTAISLLAIPARAAVVDLTGQIVKPGGSISGTSTTPVPAGLLYDISAGASGTSTGSFAYSFGNGDLQTNLTNANIYGPGFFSTLVNITGKLPVTFSDKYLPNYFGTFPIGVSTNAASMVINALVKFEIDKNGFVHVTASKLAFTPRDSHDHKLAFTGNYTVTSGSFSVVLSAPVSTTPLPSIIFPLGHFEWDQADVSITKGTSKTVFFIVKNDGPSSDNFTLSCPFLPLGITTKIYSGTTNITDQVNLPDGGSGYPIAGIASGGTMLIKVVVTAGSKAAGFPDVDFNLYRTSAPSNVGTGSINLRVR